MLSTSTFYPGVVCSSVVNLAHYLRALNCCGRWPQRTMGAEGRKEGLFDFSNVVAFGHNELCRPMGAKVSIKLARISPIGNTGVQSFYTGSSSSSSGAASAAAAAAATAAADTASGAAAAAGCSGLRRCGRCSTRYSRCSRCYDVFTSYRTSSSQGREEPWCLLRAGGGQTGGRGCGWRCGTSKF